MNSSRSNHSVAGDGSGGAAADDGSASAARTAGASTSGGEDDLAYVRAGMGEELDTVLVFNLLRTHSYLEQFIDADLRAQRLTAAQFNVLLVLDAAPNRELQMGQIGRRLVVTKSNVTGLIDRLERQGLVDRVECDDRRARRVRLTESGRELLAEAVPRHTELMRQLTDGLGEREKRSLVRLLSKLRRALRGRREACE